MLRAHCVRRLYNASDPSTDDMLYEIDSVRRFADLSLSGPIADLTTILNFHRLREKNNLGEALRDWKHRPVFSPNSTIRGLSKRG